MTRTDQGKTIVVPYGPRWSGRARATLALAKAFRQAGARVHLEERAVPTNPQDEVEHA